MDIIIGAGISGLSYANFTKNQYLILEKDSEIGGYCKTIKKDGFTWDYSGHFFHFQNREIEDYILKNMKKETVLKVKKNSQIYYNSKFIDFPFQKNIHQLEKEEFIDCLYDLFENNFKEYENFKEMLYAKFGKSISEKFLIPYNEKLYACNLNNLDKDAMGRFFPYADKNEIIKNFKTPENESYNSDFTYPKGGAIEYVNSLVSNLESSKINLNEKLIKIDLKEKKVFTTIGEYHYDNLISSVPFPYLLKICDIEYEESIYSWNKVLVFNLGFNKKGNDVKNHWVYFPNKETSFYRIGYYDNIFNDDRMSIYVEIGFDSKAEINVEEWKQKVLKDLVKNKLINDHQLISEHFVIMNPAYVHINKDSIIDVQNKKEYLEKNNVFSIGRYGSWTYCSIEDNIIEALNLTKEIK